jgi:ornithine carbamoyltransferase
MKKDLISIKDLTVTEIEQIFALSDKIKKNREDFSTALKGKSLGLVFQKPSNRTRVSFEVGMFQLGGQSIYLGPEDIKLGIREPIKDIARVLSRYLDGIVARTFSHSDILELAKYATIPLINGLTDLLHPCQALSDIYTIREKLGRFRGLTIAYVGDGNNVLHSLLHCCSKLGINLKIATPKGYGPDKNIFNEAKGFSKGSGAKISLSNEPNLVVKNSDIIYTDVWTSMGQEKEYTKRLKDFKGFQVNSKLVSKGKKGYSIMHCLPAHRGEEITDEVIDSKNSIVFDQAENRLHVQKAILILLLGGR